MQSVSMIYKKNYHVGLRDVDFTKKLKLSTLFTYFQEIASLAAEQLGYGIDTLRENFGAAWVLTRIRVEIQRIPLLDEEITIETWPLKPGKIELQREFYVRNKNSDIIIKATSKWVIIDIKERKLKRSESAGIRYPEEITERAVDEKLKRLNHYGNPEEVYTKVIGYSDIDFNGHLNNSKYVDYMMDCFPVEEHRTHTVHSIDIQFNHEALPGDSLTLYKDLTRVDESLIYIEGKRKTDNQDIFKSEIQISTNPPL